ncbi:Actin-related protein [Artemisia annua]|uniref:Actin-related protein n=1 Tax=Artemisia annua TaxID=35608 RepID=A0A2U1NTW6_ARTAN|nr:Actin-related protein [Artemisia annua]
MADNSHKPETNESPDLQEGSSVEKPLTSVTKYKEYICGEEAMRISPTEPYCLRRPIRRGHLNISLHYSMQQVLEDLQAIWDWILIEKLHIPHSERNMYSALIVVPETFDNRGNYVLFCSELLLSLLNSTTSTHLIFNT